MQNYVELAVFFRQR